MSRTGLALLTPEFTLFTLSAVEGFILSVAEGSVIEGRGECAPGGVTEPMKSPPRRAQPFRLRRLRSPIADRRFAPSEAEGSHYDMSAPTSPRKPFRMRRCKKCACNCPRIRTYKNKGLKPSWNEHLQKNPVGGPLLPSAVSYTTLNDEVDDGNGTSGRA